MAAGRTVPPAFPSRVQPPARRVERYVSTTSRPETSTVGIDVSPSGWDSDMIEYPVVFDVAGRHYMLYNGNGFGRTGMGLAVLAESS